MKIPQACQYIINQLVDVLSQIRPEDYSKPSMALSQSTIGQHLRHTLEFFICFEKGFDQGIINYDKRAHDKLIESDKFIALNTLKRISEFVDTIKDNIPLKLEVGYDLHNNNFVTIDTNTTRELVYNIEHAVHHMAIIKIGIRELATYIHLPSDFGIAVSTVKHKTAIAHTSH